MRTELSSREDEYALVRKARRGDQSAFSILYRQHASSIYTLAYRMTGNTAMAEDITQDTFLRMLQFLNGFHDRMPLRPWLKKVAANAAIDRLRRNGKYFHEDALEARFEDSAIEAADLAEVDGLLRRLPPLARTLVWLHEMEGWTHSELAERFGRSPSWSKSVISRALASLRTGLIKEYAE